MSRTESGSGGVVTGSYSYTDANGDLRQVRYTADAHGYRPEGDISVDRKTAAAAAALAALAPKAPNVPNTPNGAWVPSAPASPGNDFIQTRSSYNSFGLAPAPVAWAPVPSPIGLATTSYQVDTPTHKIWVKY